MKALIIGGGGFVGRYLAEHLLQDCGWETIVTKLPKETVEVEGCEAYNLDILDKDAVEALLVRHKPDAILHLAAQSSVAYSWKNPQLTADINIHGSAGEYQSGQRNHTGASGEPLCHYQNGTEPVRGTLRQGI